jgi:integrase
VDLRDKAIIGVLIYTAARAGAVAKLKLRDLQNEGTQYVLRFNEKGGKSRAIPVRYDLQRLLEEYQLAALFEEQAKDSPFFRSAAGKSSKLSDKGITAMDICRMMKRRLAAAGMQTSYSCPFGESQSPPFVGYSNVGASGSAASSFFQTSGRNGSS